MTIRFIYFDLGNVLLDFSHEQGFQQMAQVAGVTSARVHEALFQSGLSDRYEHGQITTEEMHAEFDRRCETKTELNSLMHAWGNIFELHIRTFPIVAALRAAGYGLGILSNTCATHWDFARSRFRILEGLFDQVVTSYQCGVMKPDPRIYAYATERAQVLPTEIFFTDDLAQNVDGARAFGWHAHQFTTSLRLANELTRLGVSFNR